MFLISSKAGSEGINLVAARRLVIYDFPWNPVYNAQVNVRCAAQCHYKASQCIV